MRWIELSSRVDGEAVEAVSEVFTRLATGGVVVEPDLVPGVDDGFALGRLASVRAYIPLDAQAAGKARALEEALWHLRSIWPVGELEQREVDEEDWAHAWKKHYSTFRIGSRIVIRPSWLDYQPSDADVVISLDPGAAFGTGLHPTTRRCVELLEQIVRPGSRVLDVGTGSGILALAAVGLGAERIVAVDVDPIAVDAARSNVHLNQADDRVEVLQGSIDAVRAGETFDVVVANIIARVILELAPRLTERVRHGGFLLVGGIIDERADEVAASLERLGLVLDRYVDDDWITLLGRFPGSA